MSMDVRGDAEEAQEPQPSKAYAWKRRRRKRQDEADAEETGFSCLMNPRVSNLGATTTSLPNGVTCRGGVWSVTGVCPEYPESLTPTSKTRDSA